MTGIRLSRIFWIGAAAILVVAALVSLVAVVRGEFSDNDARILGSLAAVLYTGGTALSGLGLVDLGRARAVGWLVVAASPVCLGIVVWAIWNSVGDGGENEAAAKLAWSAVILLFAGLITTTGLLIARRALLAVLALGAGALAAVAATLSVIGIWVEPDDDAYVKTLAVVWILAALAYFLVPVLQRYSAAGAETTERVLAELGGVELVATRSREGTIDGKLVPGERLLLRRAP